MKTRNNQLINNFLSKNSLSISMHIDRPNAVPFDDAAHFKVFFGLRPVFLGWGHRMVDGPPGAGKCAFAAKNRQQIHEDGGATGNPRKGGRCRRGRRRGHSPSLQVK